jgi:hypothetical protein
LVGTQANRGCSMDGRNHRPKSPANRKGRSNVRVGLRSLEKFGNRACRGSFLEAHDAATGLKKERKNPHTLGRTAGPTGQPPGPASSPRGYKTARATRDCFPQNLTSSNPPFDQTAALTSSPSISPDVLLASLRPPRKPRLPPILSRSIALVLGRSGLVWLGLVLS